MIDSIGDVRRFGRGVAAAGVLLAMAVPWAAAEIVPAERGAVVETPHLRLTLRDGVLVGIVNRFTGEEYVDPLTRLEALLPHLPSGLGTQHRDEERQKAFELFHYPWGEHATEARWPNQHYPTAQSAFAYEQLSPVAARLTYAGLTDGTANYDDEAYVLTIEIEANGDVAITPEARSPRPGVYGVNLTVAPLMPAVTVEAPIFDGLRITRDMKPLLWNVLWANYWDYAFVALNGWKRGAVGIWCPDPELKYSKSLYHLVNDEGLSLAFHGMNIPPFDELLEAKPVTWKIQAFEHGWSEAAAHFRAWRLANVKIAERPAWASQISFVNMGVNAARQWLDLLDVYFEGRHLERTLTFAATIREEGFDRNHANNRPYKEFKEHMVAWKEKGAKLMAYLNPVIMWSPNPKNEREELGVKLAAEAKTIMPFQGPDAKPVAHFDVQHLGHPGWQRWFLDWVKEYIQEWDADGVYHDEGQKTPLDNRGLAINNLTTTMGRAEYHYRAQAENPNSIHGAEHQTSVNNVGVSTSIGGGILWGTAPSSMRHQRIRHASPVSNALHYPNGTIRAFPHYSEYHARGNPTFFHWGMDQQEKRAEIAGHSVQNGRLFKGEIAPFAAWVNELWIERTRATTFVWEGLRPHYPEAWQKGVLSYFRAADGGDFRYVQRDWGSALVEVEPGGGERLIYARLHGTIHAPIGETGAIAGWPMYNDQGPAGLNPSRYYCFDPNRPRPTTYFRTNNSASPGLYEGFVNAGAVTDTFATLDLEAIPEIGNITRNDNVVLVSQVEPLAIWVNGKPYKVERRVLRRDWVTDEAGKRQQQPVYAENEYQINFALPAKIQVLLRPPAAVDQIETTMLARWVSGNGPERRPIFDDAFVTARLKRADPRPADAAGPAPILCPPLAGIPGALYDITVPVALPEAAVKGTMVVRASLANAAAGGFQAIEVNGVAQSVAVTPGTGGGLGFELRLPLDEQRRYALAHFQAEGNPTMTVAWEEAVVEPAGN